MPLTDHPGTIVVGYDGSDTARAALRYARRRAGDEGRIFVVHAYAMPADVLGMPNYDDLLEERVRHGREVLGEIGSGRGEERIETELIGGDAAEAIAEVARVRDADEIVIGARGRSRARAILGSVSLELLHLADRPVVVITPAAVGRSGEAVPGARATR